MRRVARRGVTLHTDASAAEVESADRAYATSGTHREQLEMLLADHPEGLTQYQCAELLGWNSRDNVNPRMQELKAMDLAYQSGEKRETGLGGVAAVWKHARFTRTQVVEEIAVKSTGRVVLRTARAVPAPRHQAAPEKDLRRHAPKVRRRGAQSKQVAEPVRQRRVLTPEEKEARAEQARQRDEEMIRATRSR
jgi:hypothetical protein